MAQNVATFLQIQGSGPSCCLFGGQLAFFSEHSSSDSSKSQLPTGPVLVSLASSEGTGRKGGWGWNSVLDSTTVEIKRAFFSADGTDATLGGRQCLLSGPEGVRLLYRCSQCHRTPGRPTGGFPSFCTSALDPTSHAAIYHTVCPESLSI